MALSDHHRVKVVWIENDDPAGGNVYGMANDFRLMGYDTDDDVRRVILSNLDDYSRPIITSDGSRIVYTDRVENVIRVVNWDGSNRRDVRASPNRIIAGTTWFDPATGIEWVYFEEGSNSGDYLTQGTLKRVDLDAPAREELIWDQTFSSHGSIAVASDGSRIAASLPWPDSGLLRPTYDGAGGGAIFTPAHGGYYDTGCWPVVTPDERYIYGVFDRANDGVLEGTKNGSHRAWKVWDNPGGAMRVLDLHQIPGNAGWEVFHPRISNHPQFVTVTGPYTQGEKYANNILAGGPQVEVFLGKVDADFAEVTDWVQITANDRADFYPHAWVSPVSPPPVRIDSFWAIPSVIIPGTETTLTWETHNGAAVSILPGGTSVAASGSLVVSPTVTTVYTLVVEGPGGPVTRDVPVSVVSFSLPLAIDCGGDAPSAGWTDDDPFRAGGEPFAFDGPVDTRDQVDPAPDAVYLTCARGDHAFSIPVADGVYTIRLHFYDPFASSARAMVYEVEGARILDGFNVAAEADDADAVVIRQFVVEVADGNGLQIDAFAGTGNDVFESGLEIIEGGVVDELPPSLSIDSPADGASIRGDVVLLGTASDDVAVSRVDVRVDDGGWEMAQGTETWSFTRLGVALADGEHSFHVRARDPFGNEAFDSITVTTDNAPRVQITRPTGGERWVAHDVETIEWTTQDLEDVTVLVSLDGGSSFEVLAASMTPADPQWGRLPWVVPDVATEAAQVVIQGYFDSTVRDASESFQLVQRDAEAMVGGCSGLPPHWIVVAVFAVVGVMRRRSRAGSRCFKDRP